MIKDMISALDEDFAKLSLTSSFKVPKYRKDDFSVQILEIANSAHTLDDDLHQ